MVMKHVNKIEKSSIMRAQPRLGMDNCTPIINIKFRSGIKDGYGIIEMAERGVGALELEVQDVVLVEAVSEDGGVCLQKVG